jgi:GNAT superfamily N-acetyltransferase
VSPAASSEALSLVHKLSSDDETDFFDCGQDDLNRFLKRFALANQAANAAQTYVTCRSKRVVGYYSLAVGSVQREDSPTRAVKGMAHHPVPVMILARLAVDRSSQGSGLGTALLKNALLRTAQAADIAGIRALVVHAKDHDARRWYEQFEFEQSPTDPLHLFLLLKDLKKLTK